MKIQYIVLRISTTVLYTARLAERYCWVKEAGVKGDFYKHPTCILRACIKNLIESGSLREKEYLWKEKDMINHISL